MELLVVVFFYLLITLLRLLNLVFRFHRLLILGDATAEIFN
jgi:hypothetical protein